MRTVHKLPILALGLAVAAAVGAAGARPEGYAPGDAGCPIAAGGGVDTIGRVFAAMLAERLKQPWVVENRPGAGGVVGLDLVAKAAPDGHTLRCSRPRRCCTNGCTRMCPMTSSPISRRGADRDDAAVPVRQPALPVANSRS